MGKKKHRARQRQETSTPPGSPSQRAEWRFWRWTWWPSLRKGLWGILTFLAGVVSGNYGPLLLPGPSIAALIERQHPEKDCDVYRVDISLPPDEILETLYFQIQFPRVVASYVMGGTFMRLEGKGTKGPSSMEIGLPTA
jgi:hypothetical protein